MQSVFFITLGCKVNQYDSQAMLARFEAAGYAPALDEVSADVVVVNTCTVTGVSDQKSRQAVAQAHRHNPRADIVVAGCYTQRCAQPVLDMPGVRLVLGTQCRDRVVELLHQARAQDKALCVVEELQQAGPVESTDGAPERTRATLKIQDGCDNHCTYCIIPSVRGGVVSRPLEDIAAQAKRCARAGVQEAVITGIHIASYGKDLPEGTLCGAVQAVADAGIPRIRLGSLEVSAITEEFLKRLSALDALCPQFHLSLQSGCDSVLKRMGRKYTARQYEGAVQALRAAFGDCAITTDLIAGFPGETEEEHAQSAAFVQRIGFARMHVFPYSAREGTPAARMPGQLPKQTKKRRANELIDMARGMEQAYIRRWCGREARVLWEKAEPDGHVSGYTKEYIRAYAPADMARAGEVAAVRLVRAFGDGVWCEK